eukprot:scaffold23478_cov47-Attheya_sp.AAC.2
MKRVDPFQLRIRRVSQIDSPPRTGRPARDQMQEMIVEPPPTRYFRQSIREPPPPRARAIPYN